MLSFSSHNLSLNPQKRPVFFQASLPSERAWQNMLRQQGLSVTPGLIDLHSHGGYGVNFNQSDEQTLYRFLKQLPQHGITAIVPTVMTGQPNEMVAAIKRWKNLSHQTKNDPSVPTILGIGLEGPFISPKKPGTHSVSEINAAWKVGLPLIQKFVETAGPDFIRWVTIAPEMPGAVQLIH